MPHFDPSKGDKLYETGPGKSFTLEALDSPDDGMSFI
jgi:hypothetical protein